MIAFCAWFCAFCASACANISVASGLVCSGAGGIGGTSVLINDSGSLNPAISIILLSVFEYCCKETIGLFAPRANFSSSDDLEIATLTIKSLSAFQYLGSTGMNLPLSLKTS